MSAIASIGGASPLDCRLRLERVALLSLALSLLCTLTSLTHIATVNVVLAVYGLVVASPRVSTLQPRTFFLFGGALAMSILTDALLVFAELLWFLHGWNVIELLGLALCAVLKGSQLHSALVLYDHLGGTVDDVRAQVPGLDAAMPYLSSVAAATPGQRPRPRRSDFIDVERGSSPGQSGNSGGSSHTTPTASARKPMRAAVVDRGPRRSQTSARTRGLRRRRDAVKRMAHSIRTRRAASPRRRATRGRGNEPRSSRQERAAVSRPSRLALREAHTRRASTFQSMSESALYYVRTSTYVCRGYPVYIYKACGAMK